MNSPIADYSIIVTLPCHNRDVRLYPQRLEREGRSKIEIHCPQAGCTAHWPWSRATGLAARPSPREPVTIDVTPEHLPTVKHRAPDSRNLPDRIRSVVKTVFDLEAWSERHGITWGAVRQPVGFPAVELREIKLMCSHEEFFGQVGDVTFVKRGMGELFRVCSLADAQDYRELLRQTGRRIEERGYRIGALDDYDFAGFQCPSCSTGTVTGSPSNLVRCGNCCVIGCYGSVQPIANGGRTYICPNPACNPQRRGRVIGPGHFSTIGAVNLLAVE